MVIILCGRALNRYLNQQAEKGLGRDMGLDTASAAFGKFWLLRAEVCFIKLAQNQLSRFLGTCGTIKTK